MTLRNPTCGCEPCKAATPCFACCRCVPKMVCVTLTACGCTNAEVFGVVISSDRAEWGGIINCGELSVDLTVVIEKETCNIYLESDCLELSGEGRPSESLTLGQCLRVGDTIQFQFTADGYGCGDADCDEYTVTVQAVPLVENTVCGGCLCLCRDLCITHQLSDGGNLFCFETIDSSFDSEESSWSAEFTHCTNEPFLVEIRLEEGYGGACALALYIDGELASVIGGNNNPTDPITEPLDCLGINLDWQLDDDNRILATCRLCDCPPNSRCCRTRTEPPENPMPDTVFLSTVPTPGGGDCDDLRNALAAHEPIPLTYNAGEHKWKSGPIQLEDYCEDTIEFNWFCGSEKPHLLGPVSYVLHIDSCADDILQDDGVVRVCNDTDPLFFSYLWILGPVEECCCQNSHVTFEVTE